MKLSTVAVFAGLMAVSAMALESTPSTTPSGPPDKERVSYAMGMNLGFQRKESNADVSPDIFVQGLKDALEGKPLRFPQAEILAVLNQARANSDEARKQTANDKEKVSYGLGMRLGEQLKRAGTEVDADIIAEGLRDVLDGKPTKIQQSEVQPLFMQAKAYGLAQQSKKNKTAGEVFLAKNAKEAGIKLLPDGLQYRVLQEGTGAIPTTNDMIYIKMRGTFVDGRQFIRHDHYLIRCGGGMQGWRDALPQMKIGSKWQIFVSPNLAFAEQGEPAWGVGPDATLIFDLEMVSIAPPDAEFGRGRLGHAFEDSDISSPDPSPIK
jgi:FKBP-type peptidyl-prolyl cis-trans isomerase FklB